MQKMRRFFLLLAASTLWAHPHVFVDVYPKIMPDSIQIRWVFDEMNSNMLIMDYDSNADHKLDASEQKAIQNDIFDTLSEYGYYTYFVEACH